MARRDDPTGAREVARSVVRSIFGGSDSGNRPRPSRAEPVTARAIETRINAFVREVVKPGRWRVCVPGQHSGGIAYESLFDVLASQGRDFLQNTVQLALAVGIGLRRKRMRADHMPTDAELERDAEPVLLEHVEKRMTKGNGDVRVEPLTAAYAARKRAQGRGSQPIGVASGELRRALSRDAYVEWL